MTNTPPRQGTSKHDCMDMKSMLRRKPTLSCTRTIGNLQHKKIRKKELAITKATRIGISITEGLILTHTVYKPTNKGVGLLAKGLIKFWFKSKSTFSKYLNKREFYEAYVKGRAEAEKLIKKLEYEKATVS